MVKIIEIDKISINNLEVGVEHIGDKKYITRDFNPNRIYRIYPKKKLLSPTYVEDKDIFA